MSFLTRTTPLLRTAVGRQGARAFSTSMVHRKIVPEPVKDAVKTVDRKVSDKIVDGIELGRKSSLFCSLPFPYCFSSSSTKTPPSTSISSLVE
jgi:hypothetical protein